MTHHSRLIHATLATALAVVLALSVGGVAMADAPIAHSGMIGAHSLTDSAEYAGATCRYSGGKGELNVSSVRVLPPTVFARNRSSHHDQQWVGWKVELRYRPDGGSWHTIQMTSAAKAKAWDDTPAAFDTRTITVAHPVGSGDYRIYVRMVWYQPGSSTVWEGGARHAVEHYTYPLADPASAPECPAGIL
jgi:hypothetical protein